MHRWFVSALFVSGLGAAIAQPGPAQACDFTARSFGALFDQHFRIGRVRTDDACSDWEHDGGNCEYGPDEKAVHAWVLDTPAPSHQANAVTLTWASDVYRQPEADALVLTRLCRPEADHKQMADLIARISPRKSAGGDYEGGGTGTLDNLELRFTVLSGVAPLQGYVALTLTDLTLPNGLTPEENEALRDTVPSDPGR